MDLAHAVRTTTAAPPPGVVRTITLVLLGGAVLGIVARWWMRLLTDDPEFTWGGTVFIVLAFVVAGAGHSVARLARRRAGRRWSTVARVLGGVLTLPLFVGAGGMMLPTVLGAGLARWRTDWRRAPRVAAALLAAPVPVVLAIQVLSERPGLRTSGGLALLAVTYAAVVTSFGSVVAPLGDGWRVPRWLRRLTIVAIVVLGAVVAISMFGVPTGS